MVLADEQDNVNVCLLKWKRKKKHLKCVGGACVGFKTLSTGVKTGALVSLKCFIFLSQTSQHSSLNASRFITVIGLHDFVCYRISKIK